MKQELIDTFLVKIANKLTVDEKIELQKQLQACDDKAFALLMSHKKPTTKSNFWRRLLCGTSAGIIIVSCICFLDFPVQSLICLVASISTFLLFRKWQKSGKLKYMPKKKRLYEDYLKIIQSYQNPSQTVE